jgi:magnesium chelatase subunit H
MFTLVKPITRHVTPAEVGDRRLMKVVYVVLEPQYQSALTAAVQRINAHNSKLAVELSGYLVEELRIPRAMRLFGGIWKRQCLYWILDLHRGHCQKVVQAVEPLRERLDAVVVFPSMPEVMRLNKMGSFSMAQLGQSKSAIAQLCASASRDPTSRRGC